MRVVFIQVKKGLFGLRLPLHEIDCRRGRLVVDRLHPLAVQRAGILDLAVGRGLQHAARRIAP